MNLFILHEPVIYHHHRAIVVGQYRGNVLLQFDSERNAKPPVIHQAEPGDVKASWFEAQTVDYPGLQVGVK